MKLLFENWRQYLKESLSVEEAECMTLFNWEFNRILAIMEKHGPDVVAYGWGDDYGHTEPGILAMVSSKIPHVQEIYENIPDVDMDGGGTQRIKKEFLKELLFEYVAEAIASVYKQRDSSIGDYMGKKEQEWYQFRSKKQKDADHTGQPDWWDDFLVCLERGVGATPGPYALKYYSDKKISRKKPEKPSISPGPDLGSTWIVNRS